MIFVLSVFENCPWAFIDRINIDQYEKKKTNFFRANVCTVYESFPAIARPRTRALSHSLSLLSLATQNPPSLKKIEKKEKN